MQTNRATVSVERIPPFSMTAESCPTFLGVGMDAKMCTKCLIIKPINQFFIYKSTNIPRQHCKMCFQKQHLKYMSDRPWRITYDSINNRCSRKTFNKYKRYGGRGIKNLITREELKELWFRDKAYNMKRPSIDRIDNDGNYEYGNCRYIELLENIKRGYTCCGKCIICNDKHLAKGLCKYHYGKKWREEHK